MTDVSNIDAGIPDAGRLERIVTFLQAAEALKDTLRSGHTTKGRPESTAEHTWRLCLMVMLFEKDLADVDAHRLLKMCIIHDLGEAISGDVPAIDQTADDGRAAREREDLQHLCASLPSDLAADMIALWDEYSEGRTPEAVLAKGFDKIETMLQHVKGLNADDFDYGFNLEYGRSRTDRHPLLRALRAMSDGMTRDLAVRQAGK